jgi:hypothetical protein
VYARVADLQGNVTRVERRFYVGNPPAPPTRGCPATAATGCAEAETSRLDVRAGRRKKLDWKWTGTAAVEDFGDPLAGATAYRLCAYDGTGALVSDVPVPAARRCRKRACWRRLRSGGLRYKDSRAGAAGVADVRLRGGRIHVGARGARLTGMSLPLVNPAGVSVQLRRTDDAARCWGTTFETSRRNNGKRFGADR